MSRPITYTHLQTNVCLIIVLIHNFIFFSSQYGLLGVECVERFDKDPEGWGGVGRQGQTASIVDKELELKCTIKIQYIHERP